MELDELLDAATPSLWNEDVPETVRELIRQGFLNADWDSEHYQVAAIKKHLRNAADKIIMDQHDFTIEDMLNGRIAGEERQSACALLFARWNSRLGYRHFGH
jgi:hypothetical protein